MISHDAITSWLRRRPDLEIGKLPGLRMLELDSLHRHESPDDQRQKALTARIESDGSLRHPPIAARHHGVEASLLLDGVNRVEALCSLGARWVLVQEVELEDEQLILSTWHHVVEGLAGAAFLERLRRFHRVTKIDVEFSPGGDFVPQYKSDTACHIVLPDRSTYAVHTADDPAAQLDAVLDVVDLVHTASNHDRVSYSNITDLTKNYSKFSALVCYKAFSKQELLALVLQGKKFPSGLTRFSVPKRVLHIDVPLSFLKDGGTVEDKQAELNELIAKKIKGKKIRFYAEPTFIFDD